MTNPSEAPRCRAVVGDTTLSYCDLPLPCDVHTPRCQVVRRDTLQIAVGKMQTTAVRDRACNLPLDTPVEGPCVMCGRLESSVWHDPPWAPDEHPYQPPLGCAVHGAANDRSEV